MSLHDVAIGPVWLAVNVALVTAAWRWSQRLFVADRLLEHVLHATVLACACVLAVSLLLGSLGLLSGTTLVVGVAVSAAGAWIAAARPIRGFGRHREPQSAARAVADPEAGRPRNGSSKDRVWPVVWGIVLCCYLGHVVEGGILQFPSTWDALAYHIPYVDHWLAGASLYIPDCPRWPDPANNELLALWMVAPFSGDFLITLNNLPAFVILALGTVMLLETLRVSRLIANLGALLAVSKYVVMRQAMVPENDLAVAAFFVASIGYALRYLCRRRQSDLTLACLCVGILAGIKYYALGYAGLATLLILAIAAIHRFRQIGHIVATGTVCLLVFAGYWYARNVWVSGTPFYPMGLPGASNPVAEYRMQQYGAPHLWSSTLAGNPSPEVVPLTFQALWNMTGPGHVAALLLAPATLVWLACSACPLLRRSDERMRGTARLLMVVLTVACGAIWVVTPFGAETIPGTLNMVVWGYCPVRFGLSLLTLAVVNLLVTVNDLVPWVRRPESEGGSCRGRRAARCAVAAVLLAVCLAQLTRPLVRELEGDLLVAVILGGDLALAGAILVQGWRRWPGFRLLGVPTVLGVAAILGGLAGGRWHRGFADYYDDWAGTNVFSEMGKMSPQEVRICACEYCYYPFFGSKRQFSVCRPVWFASRQGLLDYMHERRITHLAACVRTRPCQRYDGVDLWLGNMPEYFTPTNTGGLFTMYRVDLAKLDSDVTAEDPLKDRTRSAFPNRAADDGKRALRAAAVRGRITHP